MIQHITAYSTSNMIKINGLFVPLKGCITNLQRFCRPVIFHNDNEIFEASLGGSALLLRHNERNLFICTKHQLGKGLFKRNAEDIILILSNSKGKKVGLTANEISRVNLPNVELKTLEDILLLEYKKRTEYDLEENFLRLDLGSTTPLDKIESHKIISIFTIAYPTQSTSYEPTYDEDYTQTKLNITVRWSKLRLELASPSVWDTVQPRLPFTIHSSYTSGIGDPDGFSGAPVFYIYFDRNNERQLGLAGIITDANREGRFSVYETIYLKKLLEQLPTS